MIRIIFSKTGYARYISHLDLQRTIQRAIKRAEIPIWLTEGFNPHPYLCFSAPLSVGLESSCEILDIKITRQMPEEEIKSRLSVAFPDGFKAIDVYQTETSLKEIAFAGYTIKFDYEKFESEELDSKLENLLSDFIHQAEISVIKKSKKSEEQINLKDEAQIAEIKKADGFLSIELILPCSNDRNINPILFVHAFRAYVKKDFIYFIQRNAFYKKDMSVFK